MKKMLLILGPILGALVGFLIGRGGQCLGGG